MVAIRGGRRQCVAGAHAKVVGARKSAAVLCRDFSVGMVARNLDPNAVKSSGLHIRLEAPGQAETCTTGGRARRRMKRDSPGHQRNQSQRQFPSSFSISGMGLIRRARRAPPSPMHSCSAGLSTGYRQRHGCSWCGPSNQSFNSFNHLDAEIDCVVQAMNRDRTKTVCHNLRNAA